MAKKRPQRMAGLITAKADVGRDFERGSRDICLQYRKKRDMKA